jgi:hypothetical protein
MMSACVGASSSRNSSAATRVAVLVDVDAVEHQRVEVTRFAIPEGVDVRAERAVRPLHRDHADDPDGHGWLA